MTSPHALTALRVVIAVVFAAGLLAFVVKGADNPADPLVAAESTGSSVSNGSTGSTTPSGRAPLSGFEEETVVAVQGPMSLLEWCLLLARTEQQQEQGLMQVTDPTLGGYDGMLFPFGADTQTPFTMKDTPMPLSIAFIDKDGKVVSMQDMEPCLGQSRCPLYPPGGRFRTAIEVPKGNFEKLGLTMDSTVTDTGKKCS